MATVKGNSRMNKATMSFGIRHFLAMSTLAPAILYVLSTVGFPTPVWLPLQSLVQAVGRQDCIRRRVNFRSLLTVTAMASQGSRDEL